MTTQDPFYNGPPHSHSRWNINPNPIHLGPDEAPPPPPEPKKSGALKYVLIAVATLFLLACIIGMFAIQRSDEKHDAPPAPATASIPPSAHAKRVQPAPTSHKPTTATIGEGEFDVPGDVAAGRYKTKGAADGLVPLCSYTVKKSGGEYVDTGAIDSTNEPAYVTLKNGETFKSSGCQPWVKQ